MILDIVAERIRHFECGHVAKIRVQEGGFGADDCVDLPQGLHRPQVREVDVGWDEIDVPEHEVGVKVDDALHTNMRQVGQIDHEACHDVEHDPYFLHAIRFLNVDVFLGELAHRGVFEREIFKEDQDARHQTEDDRENLDGAKRPKLDSLRPV